MARLPSMVAILLGSAVAGALMSTVSSAQNYGGSSGPGIHVDPPPPPITRIHDTRTQGEMDRAAGARPLTPFGAGTAAGQNAGGVTGGRYGGSTGGRKTASSDVDWFEWWTMHADRFTRPRAAYDRAAAEGTTFDAASGDSRPTRRPTAADRARVVIELLRIASADAEIRPTALASMGRSAGTVDAGVVLGRLVEFLGDSSSHNRFWGYVGLAAIDRSETGAPLIAILSNSAEGQKIAGASGNLPDALRAWAALAVGHSKSEAAVPALQRLLNGETGVSPDLKATALVALGRLARDGVAADSIFQSLLGTANDKSADQTLRAHAIAGLVLAGSRAAVSPLKALAHSADVPSVVRQSATIGLGELGFGLENDLVRTLTALAVKDLDPGVRHMAIAALMVLIEGDDGSETDAAKKAIVEDLRSALIKGASAAAVHRADRAWYHLATGIFGRRFRDQAAILYPQVVKAARDGSGLDERAAAVTALGFLDVVGAPEALRLLYDERQDVLVRGLALESLAMRRDAAARPVIVKESREAKSEWLRFRTARALAFYGDTSTVKDLVADLASTRSESVRGALTLAIGRIGDRESIGGLLDMAKDKTRPRLVRERAVAALGLIAQREDETWNEPLRRSVNLAAAAPTVGSTLSIF